MAGPEGSASTAVSPSRRGSPRPEKQAPWGRESLGECEGGVIPGLPDDLAIRCLSKVSVVSHSACRTVSRAWRSLFEPESWLGFRRLYSETQSFLFAMPGDPSVVPGMFVSVEDGKWREMPPMPSEAHFYGLSAFRTLSKDGFLYVLGGVCYDARAYPADYPVPSARVYRYSILDNRWSRLADMRTARGSFACEIVGNRIYVAGGGTRHGQFLLGGSWLLSAEVYDMEKDVWLSIRDIHSPRANCLGTAIGNKFVVMGGYSPERFPNQVFYYDEYHNDVEEYQAESDTWVAKAPWGDNRLFDLSCVARLQDRVFAAKGNQIWLYEKNSETWVLASLIPEHLTIRFMFPLGKDWMLLVHGSDPFDLRFSGYAWNTEQGKLRKHPTFSRDVLRKLNGKSLNDLPTFVLMQV